MPQKIVIRDKYVRRQNGRSSSPESRRIEVKSTAIETFLFGITLGIGATVLSLYTQKPDRLATTLGALAEVGRERRAREEAKRLQRERLRDVGFTDEEIEEIL